VSTLRRVAEPFPLLSCQIRPRTRRNFRLVAGFGDPRELEPERRPGGTRDFRRLIELLEQPLVAVAGSGYDQPVWHCAIRAAPEDRMLSDAEWARSRPG
jgi:hypothetical protein